MSLFFALSLFCRDSTRVILRDCNDIPILEQSNRPFHHRYIYSFVNGKKKTVEFSELKQPTDTWQQAGVVEGDLKFQDPEGLSLHTVINNNIWNALQSEIGTHHFNRRILIAVLFDAENRILDVRLCGPGLSVEDQRVVINAILNTEGMWRDIDSAASKKRDRLILIYDLIY